MWKKPVVAMMLMRTDLTTLSAWLLSKSGTCPCCQHLLATQIFGEWEIWLSPVLPRVKRSDWLMTCQFKSIHIQLRIKKKKSPVYLWYALYVSGCCNSYFLMLKQVFARNLRQQLHLVRLRHLPDETIIPKPVNIQVDAEGTEETLPIHESDRHPDCGCYQGSLRDRTKHVAEDWRILSPFAGGSFPLLGEHRHIIVQHKTQHEEP